MPQGSPSSGHPALSTLPGDPERRAGGPGAWASPPRPCSGSPSPASHPELSLCCRWAPEGHTTRPGHVLGERASPLANRAQTAGQLHRRAPSQFPRLKARIREGAVTRDQGAHATGGASASHRGRRLVPRGPQRRARSGRNAPPLLLPRPGRGSSCWRPRQESGRPCPPTRPAPHAAARSRPTPQSPRPGAPASRPPGRRPAAVPGPRARHLHVLGGPRRLPHRCP